MCYGVRELSHALSMKGADFCLHAVRV
jgi:hypothetical protein